MSSILRALKKLDRESMAQEGEGGEQKVKMRQIVSRRAAPGLMNRLLLAAFALVAVAAVTWLLIRPPEPQVNPVSGQTTNPPDTRPKNRASNLPGAKPGVRVDAKPGVRVDAPAPTSKQMASTVLVSPPVTPPVSQPVTQPVPNPVIKPVKAAAPKQFTLTGILWSQQAERRVAMIDDRYLKEGESFEGVTVITIKKQSVILKNNARTWTIRLKK